MMGRFIDSHRAWSIAVAGVVLVPMIYVGMAFATMSLHARSDRFETVDDLLWDPLPDRWQMALRSVWDRIDPDGSALFDASK
jgi:hypothetical protein